MNLNMVNFINNKLAFFFIFYFIASTLAYQDTDMIGSRNYKEAMQKLIEEKTKANQDLQKCLQEKTKANQDLEKCLEEKTKANEETTKANSDEETTNRYSDEETTNRYSDEETTNGYEETTNGYEETTKANSDEETTNRYSDEETTNGYEETTKANEETTKANEETTKANEETTKANEETTKANEETTKAKETLIHNFVNKQINKLKKTTSELRLTYCLQQMDHAGLAFLKDNKITNYYTWETTKDSVLWPLCNYIQLYEPNQILEENGNPKRILDELLLACKKIGEYSYDQDFSNLLYTFLPQCNTLYNYMLTFGERISKNGYTNSIETFLKTCTFLQIYKPLSNYTDTHEARSYKDNSDRETPKEDNVYVISDFYPLCDFIKESYSDEANDENDKYITPKDYCKKFSNYS